MSGVSPVAGCFTALGIFAASLGPAWPVPQNDLGIGKGNFVTVPDPGSRPPKSDLGSVPDPTMPAIPPGQYPPELDTEVLTIDAAQRAIDAFVAVRDKYNSAGVENYASLEAFVAGTEAGKRLEAEIVAHGFSDITDWNQTIMEVGFAYNAIVYDYASDLAQQIEDVRNDRSLDEEMRERLIAGLTALLPSNNNRAVLQALLDDPIYRDRLKLLQEEE